jgi:dynein heavy chain
MEVTGVRFQMDAKTFRLKNLFAMELSRFADKVADMANRAAQEQKIELQIKAIQDTWRSTSFTIAKYKKNGQDRGFVLRPADDINLEMEDQMLNLQTVGGSRFVGPFLGDVQKWTKSLNLVAETMGEWFKVQQKWMYLESIFVGSEDIRLQLPEEARNFDRIDKAFKGIMVLSAKDPNVLSCCSVAGRLEELQVLILSLIFYCTQPA